MKVASTSATGTILFGKSDKVAAGSEPSSQNKNFLDICLGSTGFENTILNYNDLPKEYAADWESRSLTLNRRFLTEEAQEQFNREGAVVRGAKYGVASDSLYGTESYVFPVDRGRSSSLTERVRLPEINVSPQSGNSSVYTVSAEGNSVEVKPRQIETMTLPPREVLVPTREGTEIVWDPLVDEEVEVYKSGEPAEITITPEVTIINHGRVNAVFNEGEN